MNTMSSMSSSLPTSEVNDDSAMQDTTSIQRVSSSDSFSSAREDPEAPSPSLFRPSADEWYPRIHLGWNYSENVDVYCYFKMENRDPEVQWAIHPLGPPFLGRPDLSGFDTTLRLMNIDCTEEMRSELKNVLQHTFTKLYVRQDRFQFGAPIYDKDEYLDILERWEKKNLDINIPGNITKIQEAIKEKFDLDVNQERVKLLTNLSQFKFSPSVSQTHDWQHLLCHNSKPKIQDPMSRKRKVRDASSEIVEGDAPANEAPLPAAQPRTSIPSSSVLQKNLLISQWLRGQLDDVAPHLRTIQDFLKATYGIEEEDATLENIRKMSETAALSESPLASRTCRGLAAEATTELAKGIVRLRSRSLNLSRNFQTTPTTAKRIFSFKTEDVGDLYGASRSQALGCD